MAFLRDSPVSSDNSHSLIFTYELWKLFRATFFTLPTSVKTIYPSVVLRTAQSIKHFELKGR